MQHDRLQGPTIDGRARNLRDDSAGKNSLYCMGANAALGSSVPDVETALISRISGVAGTATARRGGRATCLSAFDAFAIRRR